MELIFPSEEYKTNFIAAVKELRSERPTSTRHEYYRNLLPENLEKDFGAYIRRVHDASVGVGLPDEYVPYTDYWLVDNGEYIGRVSIRHTLNDHLLNLGGHIGYDIRPSRRERGYGKKILELALPKAKELGIEKVLVTCDEANIASRKIIEANGGVLEDKRPNPRGGSDKLRYWIQL
jgi:predicted acetyltransferase